MYGFFYDPSPSWGTSPVPFAVLMLLGFVVGIFGHITKIKTLIAVGVGMIFLATFLLPLAVNLSKQG